MRWTPRRAARLGYLVGRGLSIGKILSDEALKPKTAREIRCASTCWGLALIAPRRAESDGLPISDRDRTRLGPTAELRGLTAEALAIALLRVIAADDLVAAVLDDEAQAAAAKASNGNARVDQRAALERRRGS